MAESYNEDDDLRRLKAWWQQNGLALILGAGVGLAAIVGWQSWQAYVDNQAHEAAGVYNTLQQRLTTDGPSEKSQALVEQLKNDYSGTPYAAQASMLLADAYVQNEDYNRALAQLDWAVDYADEPALRHLARVRQARLLWAQDQGEQALQLLDHAYPPAFAPLYEELAGDIHSERGEPEKAAAAYEKALANLPPDTDPMPIERKLADVAGPDSDTEAANSNEAEAS